SQYHSSGTLETFDPNAVGRFSKLLSGIPGGNGKNNKPEYEIIPTGPFKLFAITSEEDTSKIQWECGQDFNVSQVNIRWTNNSDRGCGENPQNMCVGISSEVEVSTPVIASAIAEHILC